MRIPPLFNPLSERTDGALHFSIGVYFITNEDANQYTYFASSSAHNKSSSKKSLQGALAFKGRSSRPWLCQTLISGGGYARRGGRFFQRCQSRLHQLLYRAVCRMHTCLKFVMGIRREHLRGVIFIKFYILHNLRHHIREHITRHIITQSHLSPLLFISSCAFAICRRKLAISISQ